MKQRRFGLRARLCAALMMLLVALPMFANAATETYAVVSGTQTLNLRAGASTSSQWLGAYPRVNRLRNHPRRDAARSNDDSGDGDARFRRTAAFPH